MSEHSRVEGVPISGRTGGFTNQPKQPQDQSIIYGKTNAGMCFDQLFEMSKKAIIEKEKNGHK